MSESFEKWYLSRYASTAIHDVSGMEAAYAAGMERAADILKSFDDMSRMGGIVTADMIAAAIRKESGE